MYQLNSVDMTFNVRFVLRKLRPRRITPSSPVVKLLLVQFLSELGILFQPGPKLGVLKQLKMMESMRIMNEFGIILLFEVEEVFKVVNECWLLQDVLLRQGVQVKWVGQCLNKLELELEPGSISCLHVCIGTGSTHPFFFTFPT